MKTRKKLFSKENSTEIIAFVMENIRESQLGDVLPYQYEPEVGGKGTNISDESDSDRQSNLSSSSEEIDQEFETANAGCLQTLSRCKCGHCTI